MHPKPIANTQTGNEGGPNGAVHDAPRWKGAPNRDRGPGVGGEFAKHYFTPLHSTPLGFKHNRYNWRGGARVGRDGTTQRGALIHLSHNYISAGTICSPNPWI